MDDPLPKKRPLSEISHLFLSSVREVQTGGSAPPLRTPPLTDMTADLTPEEFTHMCGAPGSAADSHRNCVPVTAVIAAHFNGKQFERAKQYARHLASQVGRIGMIELDGSELRLMSFEPAAPAGPADAEPQATECAEPRQMAEALEEMNCDVHQWLLLLPSPRTPEAKALLRQVDRWVLLSTCDHDGVVSSYRMLKGLSEAGRPRLGLALLDAADETQAGRVLHKMSGVCRQFLDWDVEPEPRVQVAPAVNEHLVLLYRPTRDKAQLATAPQWAVVSQFVEASRGPAPQSADPTPAPAPQPELPSELVTEFITPEAEPVRFVQDVPEPQVEQNQDVVIPIPRPAAMNIVPDTSFADVIDLPADDLSAGSILAGVLANSGGELVDCPLRPPMCVDARLAVTRDRSLVLLAVARQGLGELRSIALAYRWFRENRELIGMALPQFAIDSRRAPSLRLYVDRADLSADLLQPMLESEHVTVQAYRKLRWGEKIGVFLEAA